MSTCPEGRPGTAEGVAASAGRVVVALADRRFALPLDAVEAIAPAPPMARVPHAGPALLGAGAIAGRIVPIIDLARLLGTPGGAVDGGDILRLRTAAGDIGIRVDRVEGLIGAAGAAADGAILLDVESLADAGLDPPRLGAASPTPLGNPDDLLAPAAAAVAATSSSSRLPANRSGCGGQMLSG